MWWIDWVKDRTECFNECIKDKICQWCGGEIALACSLDEQGAKWWIGIINQEGKHTEYELWKENIIGEEKYTSTNYDDIATTVDERWRDWIWKNSFDPSATAEILKKSE